MNDGTIRARTVVAVAVATAIAVCVAGCKEQRQARQDAADERAGRVGAGLSRVPDLVGLDREVAANRLAPLGLRATFSPSFGSACVPNGVVIAQHPAPGARVDRHERPVVRVVVNDTDGRGCGLDLPAPDPDLLQLGEEFLAFARGTRSHPPAHTETVDLYLGGVETATLIGDALAHARGWEGCPEGGYAGRTCPFSATRPLTRPSRIAITAAAPDAPCHAGPDVPPNVHSLRDVTLTPDETLTCVDYYAVQLYVDTAHRITAVNVVWAEP